MKLNNQTIKILEELKKEPETTVKEIAEKGHDQSKVNRAILELREKNLVQTEEEEEIKQKLTEKGETVKQKGSPEYRLIQKIEEEKPINQIEHENLEIALGKAREKELIDIKEGEVLLTEKGIQKQEDPTQKELKQKDFTEEHEERGLIETEIKPIKKIKLTEKGKEIQIEEIEEQFNIQAEVKTPKTGKKHFYKQITDTAREKWIEMGFKEMSGNFIVPSILNFDALYTPQDHPARELQDTFYMKKPEKTNLDQYEEIVEPIKQTHENGWTTGSKGWQYNWSRKEAAKNVLRTHTTAVSAEKLYQMQIEEEELPKKYFNVSRVFRNETVDRTHLAEFLQTDGIVVGKDLNFKHLKGYISEFFNKMGYEKFRLIPSYYPYTEMSVEVQIWSEEDQEWLGLGGAGMFRPEVVKPLLGYEAKVLAWGLGVGRIAMRSAELQDIRELYRNDIKILENTPIWRPEK